MITFDPVTPAPLSVRVVRALIPFALFFGYLFGRAYPAAGGRIPLAEAIVAGVVLIGLVFAGLVALGDLIYPATSRARRRATSEDLEITAVHAPIADAQTVVAASCAEEIARLDALTGPREWAHFGFTADGMRTSEHLQNLADAARRHRALTEATQPFTPLFTHDYDPQHHTPPRGFPLIDDFSDTLIPGYPNQICDDPEVLARVVREQVQLDAATAHHVLHGELFEVPDTGRHHLKES